MDFSKNSMNEIEEKVVNKKNIEKKNEEKKKYFTSMVCALCSQFHSTLSFGRVGRVSECYNAWNGRRQWWLWHETNLTAGIFVSVSVFPFLVFQLKIVFFMYSFVSFYTSSAWIYVFIASGFIIIIFFSPFLFEYLIDAIESMRVHASLGNVAYVAQNTTNRNVILHFFVRNGKRNTETNLMNEFSAQRHRKQNNFYLHRSHRSPNIQKRNNEDEREEQKKRGQNAVAKKNMQWSRVHERDR